MLIICMMFCANKQESFSFATNGLDVKAQNPNSPMLVSVERWWGKMENIPSSRVMKWRADNRQSWCCQRSCEHNIAAQFQNTFSISTHQTIDKHLFCVAKICSTWYLYSFYSALIIEISASNDNLFRENLKRNTLFSYNCEGNPEEGVCVSLQVCGISRWARMDDSCSVGLLG